MTGKHLSRLQNRISSINKVVDEHMLTLLSKNEGMLQQMMKRSTLKKIYLLLANEKNL